MSGTGDWTPPGSAGDRGDTPDMPPMQPVQPRAGWGKPGVIPLRPLSLGEILDGAFTTIRRYPALILGISAAVAVLTGVVNLVLTWALQDQISTAVNSDSTATAEEQLDDMVDALPAILAGAAVGLVIALLATTFLSGFLTIVVGRAVLGRPISLGDALKGLEPRLLPLLGLTVLYALIVIAGALLFVIPGIWLYVLFALSSPALVLEKLSIGKALTRSKELVRGNWWRIFGILLLAALLAFVLSSIITIPFSLLGGGFSGFTDMNATISFGGLLIQSIGEIIASTIIAPFTAIVTVLLYTDQRIRKEGLDIELARAAGTVPPAGPAPTSW